jgi:DNA invertase Pin-like site-specific DNA recombinase
MMELLRDLRCAIYTRKSTEEGLEQEFNSLHAQQEAAEAYIRSQSLAGWKVVDQQYSDGGFSGANLDRPGLKLLLSDIESGAIDCVVVYKVDRLSRSLLDFARLVALFDRHQVSFVSITQDFNSTTSLGRLTLNILLSFAQFEREIISERTRDKLSAARKKGKWIGGCPVLGYDIDLQGGRLVVNEEEARRVQEIFAIGDQTGSLAATLGRSSELGLRTKEWTARGGRHRAARPFHKTTLSLLLGNVLYKGFVLHKGVLYPGEQPAIVDIELWERVNQRLGLNAAKQRVTPHQRQEAPLSGLLFCGKCRSRLVASYTRRHGTKHRYYNCPRSKIRTCQLTPLAAEDMERSLRDHLTPILGDRPSMVQMQQAIQNISFNSDDRRVAVVFHDGTRLEYELPIPNRSGVRSRNRNGNPGGLPRISRLMALAIELDRTLGQGPIKNHRALADAGHISPGRMSQILSLTHLAPSIQEQLLFLPQTKSGSDLVTERDLRAIAQVVDWNQQKRLLQQAMEGGEVRC